VSALPLIDAFGPGAPFARRGGAGIATGEFLADCARVAALLPERAHVLNLCADRYRFAVGFAAALLRGQVSLLPPNHTPDLVAQLARHYPQLYCLTDTRDGPTPLETMLFPDAPEGLAAPAERAPVPLIPGAQLAAIVFTSGSTGVPVPNPKTWRMLTGSARGEIERLGTGAWPGLALLATVPPQHMYGLESTVLIAMLGGLTLHAGRPFYAADILAELAALPRPRGLVTTPVHLRALLATPGALPPADFMLCATAPLAPELAAEAEERLGAPLYEIYGCTEAGQVATRRTTAGPQWRTFPGFVLHADAQGTWVAGAHLENPVLLGDLIELSDSERFYLRGRNADLVNIAGKRTSLAHLNYQLNAIEGVIDGVFLMPDDERGDLARLIAIAVAPGLTNQALTRALRQRIDAAFMPRPLYLVDALPRNSTGKLTRQALAEQLARLAAKVG
jgi:acyl-coenzyme A synthetase/AMP-(fatty) acid ligase